MGEIQSGETDSGSIESPSFTDSWTFYGEAGDRVIINAVTTSGYLNTDIDLYSPAPSSAKEAESNMLDQLDHELLETGLYTILIQDLGLDDSGEYNITVLKIPGAVSSSQDPDGGSIASGETLSGTINEASDLDAFQFYGEAGDRVIINAVTTLGYLNTDIDLYSPAPSSAKEAESNMLDQLDHELLETGLYTILIQDFGLDDSGEYNIDLQKIPSDLRPGVYNPYPEDGSTVWDLHDFFAWEPVTGATGYDLYFGEDVIEPLDKIGTDLSSPSMAFPEMTRGRVYYWHVVAHTTSGDIQGPYWWFKTHESVFMPSLLLLLLNE